MPYSEEEKFKIDDIVGILREVNNPERELQILFGVLKERHNDARDDTEHINEIGVAVFEYACECMEEAIDECSSILEDTSSDPVAEEDEESYKDLEKEEKGEEGISEDKDLRNW